MMMSLNRDGLNFCSLSPPIRLCQVAIVLGSVKPPWPLQGLLTRLVSHLSSAHLARCQHGSDAHELVRPFLEPV